MQEPHPFRLVKIGGVRRMGLLTVGLLLSAWALAACQTGPTQANPGDVLFQDNFSRTLSGWDRHSQGAYTAEYQDGQYRMRIDSPHADAVSNPGLDFTDVRVQVEATKVDGPDNNLFGIICRYQDPGDFYFFAVSSDGYAGIGVSKGGRRHLLSNDTLLPSTNVLKGAATNVIRAECVGYQLNLFVNGSLVSQAQAAEWAEGDVGLMVGSYDVGGVEIAFDNLSVTQP
jgi:hypothetical protein